MDMDDNTRRLVDRAELSSWMNSRNKDYVEDMSKIQDILDSTHAKISDQETKDSINRSKLAEYSRLDLTVQKLRKERLQLHKQESDALADIEYKLKHVPNAPNNLTQLEEANLLKLSMEAKQLKFKMDTMDAERNLALIKQNVTPYGYNTEDALDKEQKRFAP